MKYYAKKYSLLAIAGIFLILYIALHWQVTMYGDDYWYVYYSSLGLWGCIKESANLFIVANPRIIPNMLISLTFFLDFDVWRIFNSIACVLSIYMMYRLTGIQKNKALFFLVIGSFFITIDILITQESIYWLTGAYNYIYPIFFVMLTMHLLIKYLKNDLGKKMTKVMPLITFFSAVVVEQSAMALGIFIFSLIMYLYIFKNKKIDKLLLILFGCTIFAFLILYFTPGAQQRIEAETTLTGLQFILTNIQKMAGVLFLFRPFQIINIILCLCTTIYLYMNKKKTINKIMFILNTLLIGIFSYLFLSTYGGNGMYNIVDITIYLRVIIYTSIILHLLITGYCLVLKVKKEKDFTSICFYLTAYGSAIVLLASPIFGYRTSLITYMLLIVIVVKYISLFLSKVKNNIELKILLGLLSIIAIIYVYPETYNNYKINTEVIDSNTKIMEKLEESNYEGETEIRLQHVPLENYKWMLPYASEPHMYWYRIHYSIPDEFKVIYE